MRPKILGTVQSIESKNKISVSIDNNKKIGIAQTNKVVPIYIQSSTPKKGIFKKVYPAYRIGQVAITQNMGKKIVVTSTHENLVKVGDKIILEIKK